MRQKEGELAKRMEQGMKTRMSGSLKEKLDKVLVGTS